jgi:hypothetical protein
MAMRAKKLTVTFSIRLDDGSVVPWVRLSATERADKEKKMLENARQGMNIYYAAHPGEYERL